MKRIDDMKIRTKLVASFGILTLLSVLIGAVGFYFQEQIMGNQDTLYLDRLVPIRDLGVANASVLTVVEQTRALMKERSVLRREEILNRIREEEHEIDSLIEAYGKTYLVPEEEQNLALFRPLWKKAEEAENRVLELIHEGRIAEADRLFEEVVAEAADSAAAKLTVLVNVNGVVAAQLDADSDASSKAGIQFLLALVAVSTAISVTLALFISGKISRAVNDMVEVGDRIAAGEVNHQVTYRSQDEIGRLADSFRSMIEYIRGVANASEAIAKGDLSVHVEARSSGDVLSNSFLRSIKTLNSISREITDLSKAGTAGKLSTRGNASQYNGAFRDMVQGINDTLDAVVDPINEANDVLLKMSKGDLTVRMNGNYHGDMETMKSSVNTLSDSLNHALSDVSNSIQTTATATSQISASVEEMTSGLNEQSTQTAEVASAVEEMVKTISENSDNAIAASQTAAQAKEYAEEGFAVVEETAQGMNRLAQIVRKSADTVHELGRSSNQIGEIVGVIEDIADQTNLLALNAAIEAARAGDQGRGFAVVADEVRKLSERTTKSTKEIADMIKKIQSETKGAVAAMEEGTKSVDVSIEQTQKAQKSLNHIVDVSQRVTDMIQQIAAASGEQSNASNQISKNVDAISTVAQQSSISNQQIAHAMNDLNRQSDNLQNLISTFRLTNDFGHAPRQRTELKHRSLKENGALAH